MKSKIIMFDCDGVLCDFIQGFTARASRIYTGRVPIITSHEQPSWNGFPGMNKAMISATWDSVKADPSFWIGLPCMITAEDAANIRKIAFTNDVYFVTARTGVDAKYQTEAWLCDNLDLGNPSVIICKKKGEFAKAVGADYCIDDKASNASTVAWLTEDKTQSYLLDRPYNRVDPDFMASSVTRIKTVSEYLNIIEGVPVHV